jgi:hypothetical protein
MLPSSQNKPNWKDKRCIFSSFSKKVPLYLFLILTHCLLALHAEQRNSPVLVLGGSFEHPPIVRFLDGSQKTILYPATVGAHGEVIPLGQKERFTPKEWDRLIHDFLERSQLHLATLNPEMIRDAHGVIEMALLNSDDPTLASCILNPGFLRRFSAVFGPELILAIPSRKKIYVFPKLANRLPQVVQMIHDDFMISPQPVSMELFELSKKGLRAIGTIDPYE